MAIQPTRPEAYDTGTLNQYAHIYDVQAEEKRARIAEEVEEAARIAADAVLQALIDEIKQRPNVLVEAFVDSGSIIWDYEKKTAYINPDIFGDGLNVEDGQVSVNIGDGLQII